MTLAFTLLPIALYTLIVAFLASVPWAWWHIRLVGERAEARNWARLECEQAEKWQFSYEEHDKQTAQLRAAQQQLPIVTADRNAWRDCSIRAAETCKWQVGEIERLVAEVERLRPRHGARGRFVGRGG